LKIYRGVVFLRCKIFSQSGTNKPSSLRSGQQARSAPFFGKTYPQREHQKIISEKTPPRQKTYGMGVFTPPFDLIELSPKIQ